MVTVISSDPRERTALTALCEARGWVLKACDGIRSFRHFEFNLGGGNDRIEFRVMHDIDTLRDSQVTDTRGDNSFSNPYRPNLLGSCCFKGQNPSAPEYLLRP